MFDQVERIIQRVLTPQDIRRIQETLDEYKQDPELVTEAFRQAKEVNNVDVKYVMGFVKTWRDQNISNLNDLRMKEERDKLLRNKSPRQYRKRPRPASQNQPTNQAENSEISSFIQRRKEERLNKILKQRGEDNDS